MKIILDAMGGDNAPLEIVKGAFEAADEYCTDIILVGDETIVNKIIKENGFQNKNGCITVCHAPQTITMEDAPLCVVNEKRDSSMTAGLRMLRDSEGDAMVSAGNTGALHTGAALIVRRIKGIKKPAIATIVPFSPPLLLLDSGANIEVKPEELLQFALMGSVYMKSIHETPEPRVGLLNNGAEETKGLALQRETYKLLDACADINFVGNIEGRNIPYGECDVLVTDGFTGNIVLKYTEGLCMYLMRRIKDICTKNVVTKLSAAGLRPGMKELKSSFDSSERGGAPILGLRKPIIKAHGSSDARAIKNAVKQAVFCVNNKLTERISEATAAYENANVSDAAKKGSEL